MSLIEINHLTYTYSEEAERPALNDLTLNIEKGEWISIIGPNGSGKSTFAKAMTGLLPLQSGTIKINDLILSEETVWEIRDLIGMVFQNPDNQFVGATVEDDVAFGLENRGVPREEMIPRVHAALESVGMADFMTREPARLSGGQKQRVAIAGVLAIRPQIIILDESTAMLDPKGRLEVIRTVQKAKENSDLTVISITHDIDEAALADRIIVMEAGQVTLSGSPKEIFSLGDALIERGLDIPFSQALKDSLNSSGIDLPDGFITQEGMKEFLWKSVSNM